MVIVKASQLKLPFNGKEKFLQYIKVNDSIKGILAAQFLIYQKAIYLTVLVTLILINYTFKLYLVC